MLPADFHSIFIRFSFDFNDFNRLFCLLVFVQALFAKMMSGVGKGRDEPPPAPAEPEASSETSGDADTAPVDV